MRRRDFLARSGPIASSGLVLSQIAFNSGRFSTAALAATDGERLKTGLEQKLADFALAIKYQDLPRDVVVSAIRVLLDTLACACGAVASEPADIAEKTIRKTYGEGGAVTIVGYPHSSTIEGAVLVNGVLVRYLDLNDTYVGTDPLHPSELIPIALAVCEETGSSGRQFIEAIVTGYEAAMRINDAISFLERGFHPLSAGAYAVPLIAVEVWGLPRNAIANAVGISSARGFTSFVVNSGAVSMMKALGHAETAVDGVFATRLAAQGFTGPSATLEWVARQIKPAQMNLNVDLSVERYRLPQVSFKRFPIQVELQAVAEAGIALSRDVKGHEEDIREIVVETYPQIISRVADAAKFHPETKGTADHSLPVCLALALLGKTSVRPSGVLTAKMPKGRGASVEIRFASGKSLSRTVDIAEAEAERPMSRDVLERKFIGLAVPVVGAAAAKRIVSLVDGLEDMKNIRQLTSALKGPGKQNAA